MRCGRKSGCGLRVAFVIERARGVHQGRRDRLPIVCRSPVLCTPFGRLAAPTHLAQRASLLAGTASDVRAPWRPACVCAVFLRVTQCSKPRDGLLATLTPSLRPVQCRSPPDPPPGSSHAPASVPCESWVKDFRANRSLEERRATLRQAPCGVGEQQSNRTQRDVVSRARSYPLEPLRRSRRAATLT